VCVYKPQLSHLGPMSSAVGPTLWQQGAYWVMGASGQLSMMICDMTEARTTPAGSTQRLTLCVCCSLNTASVVQWLTWLWPASIGLQLPIFNSI